MSKIVKHTPRPWKTKPLLTPNEDEDPMMVYFVQAGDLQERFDNLRTNNDGEYDQDELDAIHAENATNARLIDAAPDLLLLVERAQSIRHPNVKWTKAETIRSWEEWDKNVCAVLAILWPVQS